MAFKVFAVLNLYREGEAPAEFDERARRFTPAGDLVSVSASVSAHAFGRGLVSVGPVGLKQGRVGTAAILKLRSLWLRRNQTRGGAMSA